MKDFNTAMAELEDSLYALVEDILPPNWFVSLGLQDMCDYTSKIIFFGIVRDDDAAVKFYSFLHRNYKEWNIFKKDGSPFSLYVYSLLHEIGHAHTGSADDLVEEKELRQRARGHANEYFHIPSEVRATEWGLRFIEKNKARAHKLEKMIIYYLERFYLQLDLE